ncbi:hypothetical protein SAMN05518801_11816 [Novosphingobium sp. CF614]|uniref:hypothetical protein n=1 Tax=Novosphingobium sp. CF614 TaxID=1884364 RepID=UPI0008DFA5BE|nr:hypothetical protein [Novosphingobium sp. CF614]SFG34420.1 hypothetical protein SAMN05518801_11816 [Novosphingobium sp. CF614]
MLTLTIAHCAGTLDANILSSMKNKRVGDFAGLRKLATATSWLPTEIAAEFRHHAKRPVDREGLDAVVRESIGIYEVTRSVAAWKVEHAARRRAVDLSATLDSVAPHR